MVNPTVQHLEKEMLMYPQMQKNGMVCPNKLEEHFSEKPGQGD